MMIHGPIQWATLLSVAIVVLGMLCPSVAQQKDGPQQPIRPTKKLWGKNYSEAVAARDRADRLRGEVETRLSAARRQKTGKPTQEQIEAEMAKVAEAYQDVIKRWPHTEIAADCALRLCGVYQFQGKSDKAAELAAQTANEFAGTREGLQAIFTAGLIHAQARHDFAEASKWFVRIPKPSKPADAPYDEHDKLYLSAQEQLLKGELQAGRFARAEAHLRRLKEECPQFSEELDDFYRFELDSHGPRFKLPKQETTPAKAPPTPQSRTGAFWPIALGVLILIGIFIHRRIRGAKP